MELILISKSKLKIMLDEKDMKEYNIGDETDCARAETRRAIRTILDRAKDQIGFNTDGVEIFVQLYTSKSGGCELFVTKGNDSDNFVSNTAHPSDKRQKSEKRGKKRRIFLMTGQILFKNTLTSCLNLWKASLEGLHFLLTLFRIYLRSAACLKAKDFRDDATL